MQSSRGNPLFYPKSLNLNKAEDKIKCPTLFICFRTVSDDRIGSGWVKISLVDALKKNGVSEHYVLSSI